MYIYIYIYTILLIDSYRISIPFILMDLGFIAVVFINNICISILIKCIVNYGGIIYLLRTKKNIYNF